MDTGFADLPRAVLSAAVEMIDTVERVVAGGRPVRTSRGNAWEAVLADRARADQRDAIRRQVASLVGPSPRAESDAASRVGSRAESRVGPGTESRIGSRVGS